MSSPFPPNVAWWAPPEDEVARALASHLGVPCFSRLDGAGALRGAAIEVVHVWYPAGALAGAVLATTMGGAAAVVVTPLGPPRRLPRWERRFHRYVFSTQTEALAWRGLGVALGRLVVVEGLGRPLALDVDALRAVYLESAAMGRRPRLWARR